MINIIIADDHAPYKAALKNILSSKNDIKVIAEADNGSHLLDLLETLKPDVILLDIQMPVMDGIATLPEVKKLYPHIRVIMLSMLDDQRMIEKLVKLGANCYLVKTSDSETIYEAIKTCYQHEFYVNFFTNRPLSNNLTEESSSSIERPIKDTILSEKEISVLRLMCEEKTNLEIAEAFKINLPTLEAIGDQMKTKTHTRSLAGLIMYAIKNNILNEST